MDTIFLIIIAICGFFAVGLWFFYVFSSAKRIKEKSVGKRMNWHDWALLLVAVIICLIIVIRAISD